MSMYRIVKRGDAEWRRVEAFKIQQRRFFLWVDVKNVNVEGDTFDGPNEVLWFSNVTAARYWISLKEDNRDVVVEIVRVL
jgi:hypothetical protein